MKLEGFLPSSFTAGLGFLNFNVTDANPDADLTLTLTSDVNSSFGITTPQIGGSLNLLANLVVQVPAKGMPQLRTDLRLNWVLPNVSADVPLGAAWGTPTLRFENVSMNLGSLLGDIVQPIATHVKEIIEPLDPIFDLLQARIPALSDLSEVVGGPTITLLSMSKALSILPNPPSQLINMIESADRLRVFSETVNALAGLAGGGWINVGSFGISGPGGSSLLSTASARRLRRLGNWSSLVSADGGINFDGFKQQIRNLLGSDLGDDVNGLWDAWTVNFKETV